MAGIDRPSTSSVYILAGAGSSVSFGFPDGTSLLRSFLDNIRFALPREVEKSVSGRYLADIHATRYCSIDELLKKVHDSGHSSLLEYGRSFVEAQITLSQQAAIKKHGKSLILPWLERLLDGIGGKHTDYEVFMETVRPISGPAALSLNTLNYDQLIEHSLLNYLNRRFPQSGSDILNHWKRAPQVYHAHGSISKCIGDGASSERSNSKLLFWWEKSEDPSAWPILNSLIGARNVLCTIGFGLHRSVTNRFRGGDRELNLFCTDYDSKAQKKIECFGKQLRASNVFVKSGEGCAEQIVDKILNHLSKK